VAVKSNKFSNFLPDFTQFLPKVHTKNGTYIFHPGFIYQSLLKETTLSKINAKKITEEVLRFLVSANLNLITAPLIREIVNVHLLKNGFEKERLQYTRIGLPVYDLNNIFTEKSAPKEIVSEIMNWVISEYHDVNKLVKKWNNL
jgi:anaerobic ribonucleoside-triphosphate reductase